MTTISDTTDGGARAGESGILASSSVTVSDASACSTWSAANQTQQAAYAQRYVHAHGPLPDVATAPARVVAAIDAGCNEAFANDVQDTINFVQAIKNQ